MREITFRAWDKFRKRMLYNPHIEFSDGEWDVECVSVDEQMKEAHKEGRHACTSCGIDIEWGDYKRVELMQYTGMNDKDGKAIYEGDIVKYTLESNLGEYVSKRTVAVEFINGAFYPLPVDSECDDAWYSTEITDYEVIGNIYENKDLLSDKK
jgi:uncharacterized phage protein (TIGR01671 family)